MLNLVILMQALRQKLEEVSDKENVIMNIPITIGITR